METTPADLMARVRARRVIEGRRVEVLRLLHDSMDASRHIPRNLGDE
jgi:hypothetical protein